LSAALAELPPFGRRDTHASRHRAPKLPRLAALLNARRTRVVQVKEVPGLSGAAGERAEGDTVVGEVDEPAVQERNEAQRVRSDRISPPIIVSFPAARDVGDRMDAEPRN